MNDQNDATFLRLVKAHYAHVETRANDEGFAIDEEINRWSLEQADIYESLKVHLKGKGWTAFIAAKQIVLFSEDARIRKIAMKKIKKLERVFKHPAYWSNCYLFSTISDELIENFQREWSQRR